VELNLGYDDFGKVVTNGISFVDKSLLIKDFIDNKGVEVALVTRPRRFGKSFNFSMLHHFFAAEIHGQATRGLFDNLKIAQQGERYMQHQGQYPVVALNFKDSKDSSFDACYANLCGVLSRAYAEHAYILDSPKVSDYWKKIFNAILDETAKEKDIKSALLTLTTCLHQHHGKKIILLIDEYDAPIQSGHVHGYYDEIIELMRHLFSAALKTNPHLNRAWLTGILRVSKESLFSGINNLQVYSILRPEYSQYFGFTEPEVNDLLKHSKLTIGINAIRDWYNGYQIGDSIVFNPWSIVNCIAQNGILQPYWVNTSDNELIKKLLIQSSNEFKHEFESLLEGNIVKKVIDESVVFSDLNKNHAAIWSLLLTTGYLNVINLQFTEQGTICELKIPNKEIRSLYRKIIEQWLSGGEGVEWYNKFLNYLLSGDIENFKYSLKNVMEQTVSCHDLAHQPEAFYQGLMIGLTASLDKNEYEKKSNRESGLGRYDITIIPKNTNKLGIILELKSVKASKNSKNLTALLEKEAIGALQQINNNTYIAELQQRGISKILKIGLAFSGKTFYLAT
jgi:hypothetical protein